MTTDEQEARQMEYVTIPRIEGEWIYFLSLEMFWDQLSRRYTPCFLPSQCQLRTISNKSLRRIVSILLFGHRINEDDKDKSTT